MKKKYCRFCRQLKERKKRIPAESLVKVTCDILGLYSILTRFLDDVTDEQ
jgi:hypothetical protein